MARSLRMSTIREIVGSIVLGLGTIGGIAGLVAYGKAHTEPNKIIPVQDFTGDGREDAVAIQYIGMRPSSINDIELYAGQQDGSYQAVNLPVVKSKLFAKYRREE